MYHIIDFNSIIIILFFQAYLYFITLMFNNHYFNFILIITFKLNLIELFINFFKVN